MKRLLAAGRNRAGACLLTGAPACALKAYYSGAGSESLAWILGPTAHLTQWLSGLAFYHETGAGWLNPDHGILIAPACSGVNFLIIAFCMAAFQGLTRISGTLRKACWLVVSAALAYVVTLAANSLRIWGAMALCRADIYSAGLTPRMVHRMTGIAVYYLFLCLFYLLIASFFRPGRSLADESQAAAKPTFRWICGLVPLGWYLLISLGVPFMNRAYHADPAGFRAHAVMVTGVSAAMTLLLYALCAGLGAARRRLGKAAACGYGSNSGQRAQ